MLRLFRNNSPFTVIILFIFAMLAKVRVLLHPQAPASIDGYFVYNYVVTILNKLFFGSAFIYTLFAIVLVFAQAMYLNRITFKHKIYLKPTYIPAFTYLLLTSLYLPMNYFGVSLLMNWFLLGATDIMLNFTQTTQPRKHIFNASFLFCMAGVMQFSAMGYLLLFFSALIMLRPFNIGEWAVAIMGYITPLYFFICALFLVDRFHLLHKWPHTSFLFPVHLHSVFYIVLVLIGILTLFICGLYVMQIQLPKTNIYVRRDWIAITSYLLISVCVVFCTGNSVQDAWLIAMPALSLYISHAFSLEKSKWFSNFTFYFSILLIFLCQLAY